MKILENKKNKKKKKKQNNKIIKNKFMIFKKSSNIAGKWLPKSLLKNGMTCVILNEAVQQESNKFKDTKGNPQIQSVVKVKVEGIEGEYNVNLGKMTINALVEAFGEDSVKWQGETLTIDVKEVEDNQGAIAYKLYLIPEGFVKIYEKGNDGKMYAKIIKGPATDAVNQTMDN